MGKLAIIKYFSFMMLVVTVMATFFTIFGLFGGHSDPRTGTAMALLVYILPLLILFEVLLLLFWLLRRRWHWAAIPGVTLLCCIPYLLTIYQPPIFSGGDEMKSGIKVVSYNVAMFGREINGAKAESILAFMRQQQVDILCLQEYQEASGDTVNSSRYLSYFSHMATGRQDMVIFSRHPIIDSGIIDFGTATNNSAMWADVDINGRVLRVFNCHLQTTGINRTLHQAAKQQEQGVVVENNAILRAIYSNYTHGMNQRANQADQVAAEVERSKWPVVLCGDFNDVPYSYVYRRMKGDLVDGFRECGSGFMYTMTGRWKRVRIDYIFHSSQLEGTSYYAEKELSYSDHFPVFMRIAL